MTRADSKTSRRGDEGESSSSSGARSPISLYVDREAPSAGPGRLIPSNSRNDRLNRRPIVKGSSSGARKEQESSTQTRHRPVVLPESSNERNAPVQRVRPTVRETNQPDNPNIVRQVANVNRDVEPQELMTEEEANRIFLEWFGPGINDL